MPYIGNQPYQGVIDSGNIVDGSIQTGDLANSAVTTAKIADSNITSAKIADTGVTVAKLNSDVTQLITQGGGPKITGVAITNSSWTVLDDTAVDIAGGYIKLTGTNFVTGCSVVVGTTSATAVTFTSSTELRVQLPAQAAGTYILYVTNPDGGTAIRVNAVTYSATPSWVTSSTLPQQDDGVAVSIQLSATSATTYALQAGSTLPSGLTLSSGGLLSGMVSGLASDTSYSFTVVATDAELQDSPRAFTVNIAASDTYFNLTTLVINSDTAPNVLTDASSNNFNLTAYGDARASNFSPYGTGWSNYFDGSGDYLSVANTGLFGSGDWTVELWINAPVGQSDKPILECRNPATGFGTSTGFTLTLITNTEIRLFSGSELLRGTVNYINTWAHVVVSKKSGTTRLYLNGTSVASTTSLGTMSDTTFLVAAGYYGVASVNVHGQFYISGLRVLTGTGYDTTTITVPTAPPTAITNTSLLICNSNRFVDSSSNNLTITRTGDVAVRSFNPFNITNTSTAGSMYFDGTTDSVRLPSNPISALSSDFTLECWTYLNSTAGNPVIYLVTALQALIIYVVSSKVVVRSYGTADLLTSVDSIQINTWTHIAVARSGSTLSLWLNGSRASGGTITYSTAFPQGEIRIATNENDAQSTNGYISDLRLINGSAAYNPALTTITVPTQPLTAVTNTQLLTLQYKQPHNNHSFQDSSTNNHLITRNGNTTQGTFSPFSPAGWSGYFNGSSVARVNTDAGLNILSYSALECWVNLSSLGSNSLLCGRESNFWFGYNYTALGGTANKFLFSIYNGSNFTTVSSSTSPLANTWYHILGIRDGTTMRFYLNGVQENTATFSTSPSNGSAPFWMGGNGGSGSVVESFTGYLSNIRFITGATNSVAPYVETNSGNSFTPLTTNLSSVTGTQLLICQTNRFVDSNTVTTAKGIGTFIGAPSIQVYSPFKPTAAYSPITHGGSAYLDGTGDYCLVSDSPLFSLAAADFTIESWIYKTASGRAEWFGQCDSAGTAASGSFDLQVTAGGKLSCGVFSGATSYFATSTADFPLNSWTHVVLCRDGTIIRQYINGVQDGTSSIGTASVNDSSTNLGIGRLGDFTSNYLTGYMSSTRIIRGQCLYPSGTTFTPPTAPPSATTNTSLLVNFTDAAARDSTGRLVLETVGDSKVSTVQKKYGTGAMYFDGTGDYNFIPSSPALGLSGDFTIESWIYLTANPAESNGAYLTDFRTSSTLSNWAIGLIGNTGTKMYAYTNNGSLNIVGTSVVPLNSWQHLAYVRAGTSVTLYLNGVACGTGSTNYIQGPTSVTIGSRYTGGQEYITGYVDDFRITRYARYTGSSTSTPNFTPPAQTFKLR